MCAERKKNQISHVVENHCNLVCWHRFLVRRVECEIASLGEGVIVVNIAFESGKVMFEIAIHRTREMKEAHTF